MRAIVAALCAIVGTLIQVGCANLVTIDRSTTLPPPGPLGSPSGSGLAIHLDAKQRLVYANGKGWICAEPSPDALSSAAASLGLGITAPETGAASFAQALQETAGSIGLRTQSITLMRDALYRVCEGYYNGALTDVQVAQLLARSQDLTVAVLAIEQLTGAVAARQVGLSNQANATATSNLANTQANLEAARRYEARKKIALEEAKTAKQEQDGVVAEAKKVAEANPKPADNDPKKEEKLASYEAAKADYEKQQTRQSKLKSDVDDAQLAYDDARRSTQQVEDNLNAARTAASAAAQGKAEFASADSRDKLTDSSASSIATAVQTIAVTAINKGHLTDACIALMLKYTDLIQRQGFKEGTDAAASAIADLKVKIDRTWDSCTKIIDADIEIAKTLAAQGQSTGSPLKETGVVIKNIPEPKR